MLERALSKRWMVFFVTVIVHGLSTRGHALAAIDTGHYIGLADGFSSGDFSDTFNVEAVRWTKSLFLAILALARAISPEHWKQIMVALNVACSGLIAVLLVDLARRASRSSVAPAVALLMYLTCFEVFQWMRFVLTDPFFFLTGFLPFVLVARRIVIPGEPRRPVLLALSLLMAVFSRPPGAVLIPLVLFGELVLVEASVRRGVAAAIILLAAMAALFVRTAVVHDPGSWPFRVLKPKIVEFSGREKTGEVVYGRKDTFRSPPRTAVDHMVIQADRVARFFQFTSSGYSRAHNVINIAYFVGLYLLGLIAVFDAFRGDDPRRRSLMIALLMWIGVFAFFHGLTVLDYDWRFRTPLMPHFILMAACGADAVQALVMSRWRSTSSVMRVARPASK